MICTAGVPIQKDKLRYTVSNYSKTVSGEQKTIVYYGVLAVHPLVSWILKRRFSDFDQLHANLLKQYSKLPKFPPKSFFALSTDLEFNKRKDQLNRYLEDLQEIPEINQNLYVIDFLKLEEYFPDFLGNTPTQICRYLTMKCLQFTSVEIHYKRSLNYIVYSKPVGKQTKEAQNSNDDILAKSFLIGYGFEESKPNSLFDNKKIVRSFDHKCHCSTYFAEAAMIILGFSDGIISSFKEDQEKVKTEFIDVLLNVSTIKVMKSALSFLKVNTRHGILYAVGQTSKIRIVDVSKWAVLGVLELGKSRLTGFEIDDHLGIGVATNEQGKLLLFDVRERVPVSFRAMEVCPGGISCMATDLDAGRIAVAQESTGTIYVVDIEFPFTVESSFRVISKAGGYPGPTCMLYWKQRKELLVGLPEGVLNLYASANNLETLTKVCSLPIHDEAVTNLTLFAEYNILLTSCADSSLKLWLLPQTWERKFTPPGTTSEVRPANKGMLMKRLDTIKEDDRDSFSDNGSQLIRLSDMRANRVGNKALDGDTGLMELLDEDFD